MTTFNGESDGVNEFSAATGQGPLGGDRPSSPGAFGANAKPSEADAASAASSLVEAARPERRYSFNMLVATAVLAFAAGRICSR